MKVIFLDIDGVLNSLATRSPAVSGLEARFDRANVAILDEITRESGAELVVTSSWRLSTAPEDLARMLSDAGCRANIAGATPFLDSHRRAIEIQAWLDAAEPVPTHFVILDDDSDLEHLESKLVRTTKARGLTRDLAPAILAHLR